MPKKNIIFIIISSFLLVSQPVVSTAAETFQFVATMDTNSLGNPKTQTGPLEFAFRLEHWPSSAEPDIGYLYFGDYNRQVSGYTANQLVSARLILTFASGTLIGSPDAQAMLISSSWTEASLTFANRPSVSIPWASDNSKGSMAGLSSGQQFSINVTDGVKLHLGGTANYGFAVKRATFTNAREEGSGEGSPRIYTKDHPTAGFRPTWLSSAPVPRLGFVRSGTVPGLRPRRIRSRPACG